MRYGNLQLDRNAVTDAASPRPITIRLSSSDGIFVVVAFCIEEEEAAEESPTARKRMAPVTLSMSLSVTSHKQAVTQGLPPYRYDTAPHSETPLYECG